MRPLIEQLRGEGWSLRAIAAELNRRGIATVLGKRWEAAQVRNVLLGRESSST